MNSRILILSLSLCFVFQASAWASNTKDTIRVSIDLRQAASQGIQVQVKVPSSAAAPVAYQFPRTIPGIYEYLKTQPCFDEIVHLEDTIGKQGMQFALGANSQGTNFSYAVQNTLDKYMGLSAEDVHFSGDSLFILNWHYLIGYFNKDTQQAYKIQVNYPKGLYGAGSMNKASLSDSSDVFYADTYKELIHMPVMYSRPDTVQFSLGPTQFTIAYAGADTTLDAAKIKELLLEPLEEVQSLSLYHPKEYTFLYYSEYFLTGPYLTGLEHPYSTLVTYHSALLSDDIIVSTSIHEYLHTVFTPLLLRSEAIHMLDMDDPQCDQHLWFYEGVTEYLAIKALMKSGYFSALDFLNELQESDSYHKNINMAAVSSHIYNKKEQQLFGNFYTKGSLLAFQLDIEILERSEGKEDLFSIMRKLQKKYSTDKPFNSQTFIQEFSRISGLDLAYLDKHLNKKTKVSFAAYAEKAGYVVQMKDTTYWSFENKKSYTIVNFRDNCMEYALIGHEANEFLNQKEVIVRSINGEELSWFNHDLLASPSTNQEIELEVLHNGNLMTLKAKPLQLTNQKAIAHWKKNGQFNSDLAKSLWNIN